MQGIHPFLKHREPTILHFLSTLLASSIAISAYSVLNYNDGLWSAAKFTAGAIGSVLCGLCSSILIYRLSPWHPLAKYPGPALAKLSKWYMAYRIAKGDRHLLLQRWERVFSEVSSSFLTWLQLQVTCTVWSLASNWYLSLPEHLVSLSDYNRTQRTFRQCTFCHTANLLANVSSSVLSRQDNNTPLWQALSCHPCFL